MRMSYNVIVIADSHLWMLYTFIAFNRRFSRRDSGRDGEVKTDYYSGSAKNTTGKSLP